MYRIELGSRIKPDKVEWIVTHAGAILQGISHEPLLDACRQLKQAGADPRAWACAYRPGREDWDIRCRVGVGAGLMTMDTAGGRMGFRKYKSYNPREIPC